MFLNLFLLNKMCYKGASFFDHLGNMVQVQQKAKTHWKILHINNVLLINTSKKHKAVKCLTTTSMRVSVVSLQRKRVPPSH